MLDTFRPWSDTALVELLWLGHLLGTDGRDWYDFWSGLGADIGGVAILGGVLGAYRKHNCHMKGCWRLGTQRVGATSWVVCHHHHPAGRPSADEVALAHRRHHEVLIAEHDRLAAGAPVDTPVAEPPSD